MITLQMVGGFWGGVRVADVAGGGHCFVAELSNLSMLRRPRESTPSTDAASAASAASAPTLVDRASHTILHFTPSWFSVIMGTGISSTLLHQLPYQFPGLDIIANVVFALNVTLFVLFTIASTVRYILWPRLLPMMLCHPVQSLFLGTVSMGLSTIVNCCVLQIGQSWGPRFVLFVWALWWINVVVSVAVCIGVPFIQFTRHSLTWEKMTAQWILPVVSTVVTGASSAVVAQIIPPEHVSLTLVLGYILLGMGLPLAFMLMALYYGRLAVYKIPPAAFIVSAFLPLGPCGQGAYALMRLSTQLLKLAESGSWLGKTTYDAQTLALAVYAPSLILALLMWGLGLVWLAFAVMSILDLLIVQKLTFNLGWWGMTFPLGVFCTATTQIANELDSTFFKVLGTVLSLVEIVLWLGVSGFTLRGAISGKLFYSPCIAEQGGVPNELPESRKYEYTPRRPSQETAVESA